jgi:hypothetical protein
MAGRATVKRRVRVIGNTIGNIRCPSGFGGLHGIIFAPIAAASGSHDKRLAREEERRADIMASPSPLATAGPPIILEWVQEEFNNG